MTNEKTITPQSRKLGATIRKARERSGLGLRGLAEMAGINFGTLSKLESGYIAAPDPKILQRIGRALEIPLEDLYALAGYARAEGLPELPVYLRSKYKLTAEQTAELQRTFERITKKGGRHAKRPS